MSTITTKITLTIEKAIIEKARSYAKKTDRSLSELVGNYLSSLPDVNESDPLSPRLQKIAGIIKLPAEFDEEKSLRTYFEDKHL